MKTKKAIKRKKANLKRKAKNVISLKLCPYFCVEDCCTIADNITYHATMIANAEIPKMATNGQQVIKKIYFTSLPLKPQCLNFKANIGISDTSSHELIKIPAMIKYNTHEWFSNLSPTPTMSDPQKSALAGVGNPIKPKA